jgi:hypothetical protein
MAERDPETTERIQEVRDDIFGPDGYLPVLALLLASVICGLLIGDSRVGMVVSVATTAGALFIIVHRSTDERPLQLGCAIFCALVVVLVAVNPRFSEEEVQRVGRLAIVGYVVIVAASLPLVLTRALRHKRVTLNTLCATVSAYLLLGMLFAGIYRLYGAISPPFFAQNPSPEQCEVSHVPAGCPSPAQFTYFSFITMATVGYGDLTPGSDPARAFVTLEAITGQVFVITALARVVSLLGEDRPGLNRTTKPSDGTPAD